MCSVLLASAALHRSMYSAGFSAVIEHRSFHSVTDSCVCGESKCDPPSPYGFLVVDSDLVVGEVGVSEMNNEAVAELRPCGQGCHCHAGDSGGAQGLS
jgi:hypothetical protein